MDKTNYVLDTSAIFAYTKNEDGSDAVEKILKGIRKSDSAVFLSFITWMELYYVSWQEKGEQTARELIMLIESLPVERVDSYARLTFLAGRIKANYKLSVADAFIAATAVEKKAVLVHKDPELNRLSGIIKTLALPYKKVSA